MVEYVVKCRFESRLEESNFIVDYVYNFTQRTLFGQGQTLQQSNMRGKMISIAWDLLWDLYGNSIAVANRSFDPSLSAQLILIGHLIYLLG